VLCDNNLPELLEHEIKGVEWEIMWTVGI
jgi:hypothetical protein